MKFLAFHEQVVPDLASDEQEDDLVTLDIIQNTKVSHPQLKFREGVRAQALDRFRRRRGLAFQT